MILGSYLIGTYNSLSYLSQDWGTICYDFFTMYVANAKTFLKTFKGQPSNKGPIGANIFYFLIETLLSIIKVNCS